MISCPFHPLLISRQTVPLPHPSACHVDVPLHNTTHVFDVLSILYYIVPNAFHPSACSQSIIVPRISGLGKRLVIFPLIHAKSGAITISEGRRAARRSHPALSAHLPSHRPSLGKSSVVSPVPLTLSLPPP